MVTQVSQTAGKPEQCLFRDEKTLRRCRMPVAKDQTLCGAHDPCAIPCPKCSTRVRSLTRHQRVCPVEKRQLSTRKSPYYRHNINLSHPIAQIPSTTPDVTHLETVFSRLLPQKSSIPMLEALKENEVIRAAWSNQRDTTLKMEPKHFDQIASLSSLLLTPYPTSTAHVIELAAGRAYTSLYIAHALNLRNVPSKVVAVDRAARRMKADRTLRAWVSNSHHSLESFQRIRTDLAHLHLAGIPGLSDTDIRIVAKHACGSALDLALTAATKLAAEGEGDIRLVLASCCRSLCSYHAFGDEGSVWQNWGVSEGQVAQICKAAHWGLDEKQNKEMADFGKKCRSLIDHARVEWLKSVGWDAHTAVYTEASPENVCIVAQWRRASAQGSQKGTEHGIELN